MAKVELELTLQKLHFLKVFSYIVMIFSQLINQLTKIGNGQFGKIHFVLTTLAKRHYDEFGGCTQAGFTTCQPVHSVREVVCLFPHIIKQDMAVLHSNKVISVIQYVHVLAYSRHSKQLLIE